VVTRRVYEKVTENVAKPMICQLLCTTGTMEKSSPKICATSVNFKALPKVNNRPIVENSPNLVTLGEGGIVLLALVLLNMFN
jgi:hypothetical protein